MSDEKIILDGITLTDDEEVCDEMLQELSNGLEEGEGN